MPVDVDPRAIAEGRRAWRWFARRSPSTAARFQAEFDRAIADIGTNPSSHPPYIHGTRYYRLHNFRHIVVYVELPHEVKEVAVAHTSRRPGYWRRRLP
jgi:toxin ParE1/3/4